MRDSAHLARIIIDNEDRRNAMSFEMWTQLYEICHSLIGDKDLRVVHLRGAGDASFVAGADISQFDSARTKDNAQAYDENTERALTALFEIPVPTVAEIYGYCFGGGISIALCCDLVFGSTNSTYAVPPARLGLAYPIASMIRLYQAIGEANTKALIFSGRPVDAMRAKAMGIVTEIWDIEALSHQVEAVVDDCLHNAPLTLRATKLACREMNRHLFSSWDQTPIQRANAKVLESQDYLEGVEAFKEKRPAHFEGR